MPARALRVGVLINGNLVEERLFLASTPVTIGQSLRCALSVPVEGMPAEHLLFARDQGQTLLRIAPGMDARLAGPEGEIRVVAAGTVPVPHGARGKLTIGDATILFQDIAAPPIAPRPQLPASVRGTLADRIDPRLAVIVGASVVAHLAIATWAWAIDREGDATPVASNARPYHQDVYEDVTLPDPLPEAIPSAAGEPGVAAPVSPRQTPRPVVPRPEPTMSTSDADRYAQILTGADEQRGGTTAMRDRGPAADLNQQIRDIRDENRTVKVGGAPPVRDGGARLGTGPRPNIDGPEMARLPAHREEPRDGRIVPEPLRPPPPGDPIRAVLAKITTTYMPGLQRCYKKGLVNDETLSGKIAISFTVDPHGKLTEPEAHGLTAEVDACVQRFMTTWRFPFPADGDEASYSLALVLRPS